MLIDTHCHIQFKGLDDDRDAIIERCREKGVLLNLVGTQKDTSRRAVELAKENDDIYATLGTHPNHLFPTYIVEEESRFTSREEDFDWAYYESLYAQAPEKIIAMGETGMDLYHAPDDLPTETVLAKQRDVFLDHARFAYQHDLPLVIHVRDAHEPMIAAIHDVLNGDVEGFAGHNGRAALRGVIHCYTGNWAQAQQYLNMGLYIGFTGIITFPPKKTDPAPQEWLNEVVEKVPLDRVVVETDTPYLAPQKYRGKRAEPWMVEEVVQRIADVRGKSFDDVARQVEGNSLRLFRKIT